VDILARLKKIRLRQTPAKRKKNDVRQPDLMKTNLQSTNQKTTKHKNK